MKKCVKCGQKKQFEDFHKQKAAADGYNPWCKTCSKHYCRLQKSKNKTKIQQQQKEYRAKHRETLNQNRKKWGLENPDKVALNAKKHREKHRDKINQKRREKRHTNLNFKLRTAISNRIRMALKRGSKNSTALKLTDCSWDYLKSHIEKQFKKGMTWDNYGEWHIDHIQPCCSFDLTKESEQKKCFHYTNLQPLWAMDNLKKSSKSL